MSLNSSSDLLLDLSRAVPPEIGLLILNQLSPVFCQSILAKFPSKNFMKAENTHILRAWLYARLYAGYSVIYIDNSNTEKGFKRPLGCDLAATPHEFMALCQDKLFLANSPRRLDFKIARDMREHTHFQVSLAALVEMLNSHWVGKYFSQVPEISFSLNGESPPTGSPTSMSVAILNVLANLTTLAHCNLFSITIENTDIGQMFPRKWEGVFRHFHKLRHLNLRNNCISSARSNERVSSHGTNTKWPNDLKSLCLAENDIQDVGPMYLRELPSTLEVLDLSENQLTSFGESNNDDFTLAFVLPSLRQLDLSGNVFLNFLNARLFSGPRKCHLNVKLSGCKLAQQCLRDLQVEARQSRVTLFI